MGSQFLICVGVSVILLMVTVWAALINEIAILGGGKSPSRSISLFWIVLMILALISGFWQSSRAFQAAMNSTLNEQVTKVVIEYEP